jgi:hypothetical protein
VLTGEIPQDVIHSVVVECDLQLVVLLASHPAPQQSLDLDDTLEELDLLVYHLG